MKKRGAVRRKNEKKGVKLGEIGNERKEKNKKECLKKFCRVWCGERV